MTPISADICGKENWELTEVTGTPEHQPTGTRGQELRHGHTTPGTVWHMATRATAVVH